MDNSQAPNPDPSLNADSTNPDAADAAVPDDSQLGWRDWLTRNGALLVFMLGLLAFTAWFFGAEGLWNIAKAALGLGFVVFIHELGHFAVAKWCDVHVQTFSVGFGPALPGCSFRRGETTYKLALFPLGGYVKMVGEGDTSEEDEDDPRSFKNKTVGQRMAIISAGVIMNVILGCICFVIAYRSGVRQTPGVFGMIDPGSPAWKEDMRSWMAMHQIDDIRDPSFEDMRYEVMLSGKGQKIHFIASRPGEPATEFYVEPRLEEYDSAPVVGVAQTFDIRLPPKRALQKQEVRPVIGAAAAARVLDLKPGDRILAATDPDAKADDQLQPLAARDGKGGDGYRELAALLPGLEGRTIRLKVQRAGAAATANLDVPPAGFLAGDQVVGTTDPGAGNDPYDPYRLAALPAEEVPNRPGLRYDAMEFDRRMRQLAGKPMVIQVRRDGSADDSPVAVFVPPAYHQTFGLRMRLGEVAAVRKGSPAAESDGLRQHDLIRRVSAPGPDGRPKNYAVKPDREKGEELLDPMRLPDLLRGLEEGFAARKEDFRVRVTVDRKVIDGQEEKLVQKEIVLGWDRERRFDREVPLSLRSPLSIPELGVAYHVETMVEGVSEDLPAGAEDPGAGLMAGDIILEVRFKRETSAAGGTPDWGPWIELWTKDRDTGLKNSEPAWPRIFAMLQDSATSELQVKVKRGANELAAPLTLQARSDTGWPLDDRGLRFESAWRLRKADSTWEAMALGGQMTVRSIVKTYHALHRMIIGRVSVTKNLSGPIGIATMAYDIAGEDLATFVLFLGIISLNLAVVNFLPIPVLDGGHMVFLIYEKLRGKPASEQVRLAATYAGLIFIFSLMAFVIYLDIKRRVVGF